tara:strand:+ start:256 stop:837 length:582 start_codon:yes stop_codon:yes gene_type:complete
MAKSTINSSALGGVETSDANYMGSGPANAHGQPKTAEKKTTRASSKLPPNPFIFEVLEHANKQRTIQGRVDVLKEYRDDSLVSILIWNFDESVVSMIPEGQVPYEKNEVPVGTDHTSLRREYKNLYHFIKGGNDSLSSIRRETMFIQMLEGLHPKEADIIVLVKDHLLHLQYPKINKEIVSKAYPDITWGGRS